MNRRAFLYRQVADELRQRIRAGAYRRGSAIPSETALVAEFGVSAITVRRAVRELMFEGLLHGKQGLGVFVSDTRKIVRALAADARVSIGDEIRRAGLTPGLRELNWTRMAAPKPIAAQLRVRPGTVVYQHDKLVLADGEPVIIDSVYLPRATAERLRHRLSQEFLFKLLGDLGIPVGHAEFRFEGVAASQLQADLLNLSLNFPILMTNYVVFDRAGAPIVAGTTASRSDRVAFDVFTQPDERPAARDPALIASRADPAGAA